MTTEKQRIAIAIACGYTNVCIQEWESVDIESRSIAYGTELQGTINGKRCFVDNYLNDLNAMNAAETSLTDEQQFDYACWLDQRFASRSCEFSLLHATAAQRAEAFLRTLGKWEE